MFFIFTVCVGVVNWNPFAFPPEPSNLSLMFCVINWVLAVAKNGLSLVPYVSVLDFSSLVFVIDKICSMVEKDVFSSKFNKYLIELITS